MATLTTKLALTDHIKGTLGEPIITVEVSPQQIDYAIDTAIQKFSSFAMGGDTPKHYVLETVVGTSTYILDPRVESVTRVRTASNSFSLQLPGYMIVTPTDIVSMVQNPTSGGFDTSQIFSMMAEMSLLEKYFDIEPNYNYNSNTKELVFYDNTPNITKKFMIEAYVNYEPKEPDYIYNHQWVKEYSTALVKFQWGNNIGKYSSTLIGGGSLNYDRILQEAKADIDQLEAELLTKWSQPLPIIRG